MNKKLMKRTVFPVLLGLLVVPVILMVPTFAQNSSSEQLSESSVVIELESPIDESGYAEVAFTKGDVSYQLSAGSRQAARGDKLATTSIIRTGDNGFASLAFTSGSSVNIQPVTKVRLSLRGCKTSDASCTVIVTTQYGQISTDTPDSQVQPVPFSISVLPGEPSLAPWFKYEFAEPVPRLEGKPVGAEITLHEIILPPNLK